MEVGGYGGFLVQGAREDVGEAARAEGYGAFGRDADGAADGGQVGAGGGEDGEEAGCVLAVVGLAGAAWAGAGARELGVL